MKYLIALLLITPAMAYNDINYPCDNVYVRNYPQEVLLDRPYQREQAVPTAYSTQMQHYYDSIWSEPRQPQVIVIER